MTRWVAMFLGAMIVAAVAQRAAQQIWGLRYVSSAPTLTTGQQAIWRGNSSGKLVTDIVTGPCSNSLDFSDGCNSQYLPALGGFM